MIVELYMTDLADEMEDVQASLDDIQSTVDDIETDVATVDGVVDDILNDTVDIQSTVNDIETDVAVVDANVDTILAVTNALPTLSETGGTVTTDGTEQNVYVNANPLGEFMPICVVINFTAQQAGEETIVRQYYDNAPGGAGLLLVDELTFTGVIAPAMIVVDLDPNRYGVAVTIERTAGAARAYPWDVHYEI